VISGKAGQVDRDRRLRHLGLLADRRVDQSGSSGGPLCDIDGKVVGMNPLINGEPRLRFAIPINLANEIGQQLISGQGLCGPGSGSHRNAGRQPSPSRSFRSLDKGA
jgi:S1-C subfamily serine protease